MKQASCPRETEVAKAARSGIWEETLATHVTRCSACREVMLAAHWMQDLARDAGENSPVPDAGRIWQRALFEQALSEKQTEVDRAHRAMEWVETVSLGMVAVGLVAWGIGNGAGLESALAWLDAGLSPQTWIDAYYAAGSSSVAHWTSVGAVSLVALLLATRIFAEE